MLALIDHYTNWKWGIGLASKADSTGRIAKIIRRLKLKLKVMRTDKGGEFVHEQMKRLQDLIGSNMKRRLPVSHSTTVELRNVSKTSIMGPTRTNLQEACVGLSFWVEAQQQACYTINRLPCYANRLTRCVLAKPNYKKMIAFGQAVTVMYGKKKAPKGKQSHLLQWKS